MGGDKTDSVFWLGCLSVGVRVACNVPLAGSCTCAELSKNGFALFCNKLELMMYQHQMVRRMPTLPIMAVVALTLVQGATAFAPSAAFAPSPALATLSQRSARQFMTARSGRPVLALRMSDEAAVGAAGSVEVPMEMEAAASVQASASAPVVLIAREAAISTGPPGQEKQQQQRQYYEEQPQPRGELVMEKGPVNMMFVASGGVAAIAGGYFGVKFYKKRQQEVVDEFGKMMMFYVGDEQLTNDCVKEYKGKIGPLINGFHRDDMFKSYAKRLAADKALGIQSLEHFATMAKKLGVKPAKAIQQAAIELVPYTDPKETWERNANKPSVLGKLLWMTERCYADPLTVTALRKRYPKSLASNEIIDVLQNTLTEEAYKAIITKAGGPDEGVQPGYTEIGLTEADAQGLINRWIDEALVKDEEAAALVAAKAEEARIVAIREAAVAGQKDKSGRSCVTHVYIYIYIHIFSYVYTYIQRSPITYIHIYIFVYIRI